MKIILSSTNPSKVTQIKAIFDDPSFEILTLEEADIEGEAVEDGETIEENARKKAIYAREKSGGTTTVMADDTGIFINALGGMPGVISARWAGDVSTEEKTQFCLDKMKGITDRSATFMTIVVVITPDGEEYVFEGEITGTVATAAKTKPQPKMPYSPLFMPDGHEKVWAEMTTEEENAISHRGIAFRKALAFLKEQSSL
jgi:XTP/dITP diphosphohydrolase